MNGPNVPFEMFASHEALSTSVRVAGIGPYAFFRLVPAGGEDGFAVGRGDFTPSRFFREVGNRDGDFGHGAGCAAGRTDGRCVGEDAGVGGCVTRCGERGGVDAGGGREKIRVGGVGEVKIKVGAVHVLRGGVCVEERLGGGVGNRCAGRGGDGYLEWGVDGGGYGDAEGDVGEVHCWLGVKGIDGGGATTETTVRGGE